MAIGQAGKFVARSSLDAHIVRVSLKPLLETVLLRVPQANGKVLPWLLVYN